VRREHPALVIAIVADDAADMQIAIGQTGLLRQRRLDHVAQLAFNAAATTHRHTKQTLFGVACRGLVCESGCVLDAAPCTTWREEECEERDREETHCKSIVSSMRFVGN
jgi:hypothetical protein